MSDQTPPTGQPTSPDPGDAAAPTPPPARKSRKGLLVGLLAGFLVLALVGGAVAAFLITRGPDKHTITVASTAGGMKRATADEKQVQQQLDAMEQQFETQFEVTAAKSGLYDQETTSRGPKGQLLFVGFNFKTPSDQNPAKLVKKLRANAETNKQEFTTVPAGDAAGKTVCINTPADAAQKSATCLWATRDTGGALIPSVAGYDSKQMSKLLLDMRSDIEKTE